MKTNIFIALSLLIRLTLLGQKEDRVWYFGGDGGNPNPIGTGIDFNSGTPIVLNNSQMVYTEGSAIQCDRNGNLLFYSNGDKVWDKNHNIMANGADLGGGISSEQSALIIPFPNDTTKYYLFANAGFPTAGGAGLFYSIIDMTMNGSNGSVTATKTMPLLAATSEWLSGTWHSNGTDYWVVTSVYSTSIFHAYKISASGISSPVITDLGYNKKADFKLDFNTKGDMITFNTFDFASQHTRRVASFNQSTGIITNPIYIDSIVGNNGACFSPDDNLLYYYGYVPGNLVLYQCDMNAPNISASKQIVKYFTSGFYTDMKLGPDGKIYCNQGMRDTLDRINSPNTMGIGCNYQKNAIYLNGKKSGYFLPSKTFGKYIKPVNTFENHFDANHKIFPNPTHDKITINTNKTYSYYLIYDSYGKKVLENKFDKNLDTENIELKINSGIYLLLLFDNSGRCYKNTIVKE